MMGTGPWRASRRRSTTALLVAVACLPIVPPGPAIAGPVPFAATEAKPAPSVILISVDTLRADHLSCYGSQGVSTPHIDALAKGGTLFAQASAQVPLTLPSHVSLLTSTYPFSNGIEDNGQQLKPGAITLARVLKSRGYRTAGFAGGFVLDRRFGLDQGFDVYSSPFDLHKGVSTDPGDVKRLGEEVAQDAQAWLDQNAARPFFLFLHLYDLHTPYSLPQRLQARYGRPGYDSELRYVEGVLGEFIGFLQRRGLLETSLLVFTSDHGESLGEHGERTHGYFIYQSTLRVPLIFHWPATARAAVSRVLEPVSLLDVAPTILQALGLPSPPEFQGRALLSLAGNTSPAGSPRAVPSRRDEEIYSESLYAHNHFGTSALRSLRRGSFKYIEAPRAELYDLVHDPGESHNLFQEKKSVASSFHERLLSLLSRYSSSQEAEMAQALSPDVVERLNSLGYAGVSARRRSPPDSGPDPKDRIEEYEDYGHALTLAAAGRMDQANELLQQLLGKTPDLVSVRLSLGINQQKLSRHAAAAESFQEALKSDPANALAHFDLGVSEFALHRLDDAARELQVTLAIEPYYTRAEELLGSVLLEQHKYHEARGHFEHVLTVDPRDYVAHYNLGALATLEQQWADAENHLKEALTTDPSSAEAYNTLGSLYVRRGDWGRAREALSKAIDLEPKFASAHYNLGLVFRAKRERSEAVREFRQALALDPQFTPAREALDRLELDRK